MITYLESEVGLLSIYRNTEVGPHTIWYALWNAVSKNGVSFHGDSIAPITLIKGKSFELSG